jgi:ribosome biogenesis protein BRX1
METSNIDVTSKDVPSIEKDDDQGDSAMMTDIIQEEEPSVPIESDGRYRNKQRCLVLCLRGATARYRHLLEDLRTLLPHHKKESKLDAGKSGVASAVNDIAEMRSCNTVLFLECRKRQDAYMWIGRVGKNLGPSAKFHITNVHTMDELRLTGNCMKGSRPILTFDESFDKIGHLKLLKELFADVFGTPRGHPKCKPFVDRVMAFYYADKKVRIVHQNFCCDRYDRHKQTHLRTARKSLITTMMSVCQTLLSGG